MRNKNYKKEKIRGERQIERMNEKVKKREKKREIKN